jgi:hypothetical protein
VFLRGKICCCFTNQLGRGSEWVRGDTNLREDFEERTEERDHQGREEEGAGTIDMDREGVNK